MVWSAITAIFGNRKPRRVRLKMTQQEAFGERLESRVVMSANTLNTAALQSTPSFDVEPNNTPGTADIAGSFGTESYSANVYGSTGSGSGFQRNSGDDHGNNRQSATEIRLGLSNTGSMNGTIERARDLDYFKFYVGGLSRTQTMKIDVSQRAGSTLDPMMRLFNAAGQEIASNDDAGNSLNSQIIKTLARGWYYIEVTGHASSPAGLYTVSVRPTSTVPAIDDHENTVFARATAIPLTGSNVNSVSGSRSGVIERAGDQDLFRFDNLGTKRFTIDVTSSSGSQLDTYIDIYDERGRRVTGDDDGGAGTNSRLTLTIGSGRYFIRVSGVSSTTGAYTVSVRGVTESSNEGARERLTLGRNNSAEDFDQTRNGRKEYVMRATQSGSYRIELTNLGTTLRSSLVEIRDSNNRLIATRTVDFTNKAILRVNLTADLDYRINVIGASGNFNFRLNVAG